VSLDQSLAVTLLGETFAPNLISKTLHLLAPDRTIEELFGSFDDIEKQNQSMRFSGIVRYADMHQRSYSEPFTIDLRYDEKRGFIQKDDVAGELKKIGETVRDASRMLDRYLSKR
jgi:hypothetical protein